ncbi:WD40-repeat-containing domain protein [Gorgonomyces haynaldii]|nr:WD40-repeat-containing domain protein [Gorgonomyces haynaldii]
MRADDDLLWNRMCHQHINKKCDKCGWGLPLMQSRPHKRVKLDIPIQTKTDCFKPIDFPTNEPPRTHKRPWKSVYAERMVVERHWRKPQFSTRTLTGHTDGVMAVYFDKDLLVTGSFDASIRVWDVSTGECLAVLRGHGRCVRGVQFDDNKIVSCSMDRTLRIWCRKSFNCVRVLSNDSGVNCLHFEDKMLASGTVDGNIKVWNLARGCSFTLSGHSDWVNKVKIMPCHERLISCSDDTTMRLWDIATQSVLRVFSGHNGPVQALQFKDGHSDQERRLITGSLDNTVKIWNLGTGECEKTLFGHEQGVWCIGADSLRIISGSHDKTVKVWDMCSGNLLHSLKADAAVNACWLSDTMLITGDDAGQVIVRDFLNL